jgi:hypothetical protein
MMGSFINQNLPVQFKTSLGPALWAALLAVPACILLLYFLKLKRQPVVISSTLLWRRSMEDLRVNSLFQRLRRNILMFLQLLLAFLILIALTGPKWADQGTQSRRLIIAIDNSTSMSATDVKPDRLTFAKNQALEVIGRMSSADLAMVIAFSDTSEVVSSYTSNKNLLRQKIQAIEPTQRRSDLRDALQVADGLANPSRQMDGVVASEETTPRLMIYTDGGFQDIQGFSLGNLEPELVVIGNGPPVFQVGQNENKTSFASKNTAILALQARRNEESPNTVEVFGRIKNYDAADAATELKLYRLGLNGDQKTLIDAIKLELTGESERGFQFTIADIGPQALMVESSFEDDLKIDNIAYAAIEPEKKPKIRLVTKGNRYLSNFFKSSGLRNAIDFSEMLPDDLAKPEVQNELKLGTLSLVIFDACAPLIDSPQSNCLYFGAFPPGKKFESLRSFQNPAVLDWDSTNPILQYIRDLGQIRINTVQVPDPLPAGVRALIESDKGPILTSSPREGFMDVVVGFALTDEKSFNTDWFLKYSFPLFLSNCLQQLAGLSGENADQSHAPGSSFAIAVPGFAGESLQIHPLENTTLLANSLNVDSSGRAAITAPANQGVFAVKSTDKLVDIYSVDLFDDRESDLSTRGLAPAGAPESVAANYQIKIGFTPVTGKGESNGIYSPLWKIVVVIGLIILSIEWFIYNRRVAL